MPHFETWPELWVQNESDYPKAKAILDTILERLAAPGEAWKCGACGEENDASFEICWQCSKER